MTSRSRAAVLALAVVAVAGFALALTAAGGDGDDGGRAADRAVTAALRLNGVDVREWDTDFTRASVPLDEIRSGGPGKDGIPPIDEPAFTSVAEARRVLPDAEPVLVVEGRQTVRAYPLRILVWHEIVNDVIDGVPLAVTFCPLCNSAVVFERRVDDRTLRFGTTGRLRRSDLVMWDDATESWWQQITGEAIVGELTGATLTQRPALTIGVAELARSFPGAEVLSQDTGFDREYGRNPYVTYDAPASEPFLLGEEADRRLPPKQRVLAVRDGRDAVVVPLDVARDRRALTFTAFGREIVALWAPGVVSALDEQTIGSSREIGTAALYDAGDAGALRPASGDPGRFRGADGTVWDIAGRAVAGPRRGERLERVTHDQQFWFALAAFLTGDVEVIGEEDGDG